MKGKIFTFDVETGGLDCKKNALIQIAYLIEIDGKIEAEGNLKCKPFAGDILDPKALEVNGQKESDILEYPDPRVQYKKLVATFGRFINKYDKTDKFYPSGYNVRFDLDFLKEWFVKNGDTWFASWQNWRDIDPFSVVKWLAARGEIDLPNLKLATIYRHVFGKKTGRRARRPSRRPGRARTSTTLRPPGFRYCPGVARKSRIMRVEVFIDAQAFADFKAGKIKSLNVAADHNYLWMDTVEAGRKPKPVKGILKIKGLKKWEFTTLWQWLKNTGLRKLLKK